jgi:4-oxalocrotonate tautomerase
LANFNESETCGSVKTLIFASVKLAYGSETSVSIAIEEIAQNEWMKKVYETEITPNFDKLYKKPGY